MKLVEISVCVAVTIKDVRALPGTPGIEERIHEGTVQDKLKSN